MVSMTIGCQAVKRSCCTVDVGVPGREDTCDEQCILWIKGIQSANAIDLLGLGFTTSDEVHKLEVEQTYD